MIATPWGESETLRQRRLKPGPGSARETVVGNQRERLFSAMVASVAERGYEATSVAHVLELSGVSGRTFYDLFPDKRACFVATLEAIVEMAIAYVGRSAGDVASTIASPPTDLSEEEWRTRARTALDAFARMVVAQPAAARLLLVDAYAAGPSSLAPLEQTVSGFEAVAKEVLDRSPERADMPAEMIAALIGGLAEIARMRLIAGTEDELPEVIDDAWGLLLAYRRPPAPLRSSGRTPKPVAETIEGHDHAERALRALTAVVAEVGYADATVGEALRRAQMSATTFYTYFDGKQDAMLAAIDSGASRLMAAALPAFRRAPDWRHGIRSAFGSFFDFLASRPALATLLLIETYAAGPRAIERRQEVLLPLAELVATGGELPHPVPRLATEGILSVTYTLGYRGLRAGGPGSLPSLAPLCTYLALSPLIGADEACFIAAGDGSGRER
jgi:AcrR family transcriptional regulator